MLPPPSSRVCVGSVPCHPVMHATPLHVPMRRRRHTRILCLPCSRACLSLGGTRRDLCMYACPSPALTQPMYPVCNMEGWGGVSAEFQGRHQAPALCEPQAKSRGILWQVHQGACTHEPGLRRLALSVSSSLVVHMQCGLWHIHLLLGRPMGGLWPVLIS